MSSSQEKDNNKPLLTEYEWMIRPCEMYKEEYGECTSIRGRFHQYFIYGETLDCAQWKRDLDNCEKWKDNKDNKAADLIIKSEQERRRERLKSHYSNNTWERRQTPPDDWNKPLPEYISKDYEFSYLGHKAKEMRGEVTPESRLMDRTFCVIM